MFRSSADEWPARRDTKFNPTSTFRRSRWCSAQIASDFPYLKPFVQAALPTLSVLPALVINNKSGSLLVILPFHGIIFPLMTVYLRCFGILLRRSGCSLSVGCLFLGLCAIIPDSRLVAVPGSSKPFLHARCDHLCSHTFLHKICDCWGHCVEGWDAPPLWCARG